MQYKRSVQELMDTLNSCSQHYIRCIKPNDTKQPGIMKDNMVITQAKYLGLLENVKGKRNRIEIISRFHAVRRAGYAFRMSYDRFMAKYKCVGNAHAEYEPDTKDGTKSILKSSKVDNFQMGHTKVFIKNPKSIFSLEDKRKKFLEVAAGYLPEGDGLIFADKVFGLNKGYNRQPLMFVVGGEGFYFFELKRSGEPDSGAAAHFFAMDQVG